MSKVNDGGAAFPRAGFHDLDEVVSHGPQSGMSLRDWFAGQALAGLCAATDRDGVWTCGVNEMSDNGDESLAASAYGVADAMLKARQAND